MPNADVVVIGAGLSGLVAAARLAEGGARVHLVAKGHASTHWTAGGLDLALLPGTATPREGIAALAGLPGHPYARLGREVEPATAWFLAHLAAAGLPYVGGLDTPIRRVPTAIGGTRLVAIVPDAQAAALRPWAPDETLVVVGPAGFKDFWPAAVAGSLARPAVWRGADRPARVVGVAVDLPGMEARRNLTAVVLGELFDSAAWRASALDVLARAVERAAGGGPVRVALPAILGLDHHGEVLADARRRLPGDCFEVPLVPPSLPGIRLFGVLRDAIRRAGGRVQVGESVARLERDGDRIVAVHLEAAARTYRIGTATLVLATGGIAGGGLVAPGDETLVEPLLGLPVDAPPGDGWLAADALDPTGHPIEAAGIRTDDELRPVAGSGGAPVAANVRVVGSLLAGMRFLRERCGDGVALASGSHAAASLLAGELTSRAAGRGAGGATAGAGGATASAGGGTTGVGAVTTLGEPR